MNLRRLARLRAGTTTAVVVTVVLGALAFALSAVVRPHDPKFALTSDNDPAFTITSTIYATYPSCSGAPTAPLAPGVTRCLAVTVSNPLTVPIKVKTLSMTVPSFTPTKSNHHTPACTKTMVTPPTFMVTFTVPGSGTYTIDKSIKLTTTHTTQDNCEQGTFHFSYAATATFTDGTTTVLAASPSPATEGSPVTFTATVTGKNPTYDHTTKPHGKVTLYRCATSSCTTVASTPPVTATITGTTGKATFSPALLPQGKLYFEAKYEGTGTNFTKSTSNILTLTVQPSVTSCVTAPTTKAMTIITGTYHGNLVVPPFRSVWLDGGTITGNVQVAFLGSFAATKGTIDGDLTSAGLVSLQGTKVDGFINAAGALGIGPDTTIGGSLNVNFALALCAVGTSASPITVGGSVNVHGLPVFFSLAKLCGMSVAGSLTYSSNAASLEIGGSGCPGNTIKGSLDVEHNTKVSADTNTVKGSVTVSSNSSVTLDHNAVTGNLVVEDNLGTVTITDNTAVGSITVAHNGGGALTSNKATGSCSLGTDFPLVTGKTNTVPKGHSNTCNRKA